jgi:hypothetical protein
MKISFLAITILVSGSSALQAQGTFLYDQQSVLNDSTTGEAAPVIQSSPPFGQSFTPTLSSVGFIRLALGDSTFNGIGATLYVNLRSNSVTGPILGSTEPIFLPDASFGKPTFLFPTPVDVTPGQTYFFEPVVQSGDLWQIVMDTHYNYTGGMVFALGQPGPDYDLWFREGIIIPEPSSTLLLLTGAALFVYARRKRCKTQPNRYQRVDGLR